MIKRYGPKSPHDDFQGQWLDLKDLEAFMNLVISANPDDVWAIEQLGSGGGRLLEAGCGAAPFVIYFKRKGYNIDGVDFAEKIVERLNSLYPDLNIFYGDCTNLFMVPDNTYDGYISLGVIEHLEEGPNKFLEEAYRILKPTGKAWITVPYIGDRITPIVTKPDAENPEFFENVFSEEDLVNAVERNGFQVKKIKYTNHNPIIYQLSKLFRHRKIKWKLNWLGVCVREFLRLVGSKKYAHSIGVLVEKMAG
ncbi:MAG: class I SAM-dependent methyltransferase [Puniceicoccales bacterium]|nr:class I SAM-dependent methyltransferase [Puniceicoccales bacterium]